MSSNSNYQPKFNMKNTDLIKFAAKTNGVVWGVVW